MKKLSAALAFVLLTAVLLSGCTPNEINIAGKTYPLNVNSLYLHGNGFSNGDIKVLRHATNLDFLTLADNNLTEVGIIKDMTTLTGLDLGGNKIKDIKDLKNLTGLTVLNLRNNEITDISVLAELPNLQELNLSGNQITDISVLKGMTNLRSLECANTALTDEQKQELLDALPNCDAWFAVRQQ